MSSAQEHREATTGAHRPPSSPSGRTFLPGRRKAADIAVRLLCLVATLVALVPLLSLLQFVIVRGAGGLSWDLLTHLPKPVGETGGGMANAILGTLVLVGMASVVGIPLGIITGIYMAEHADTRSARVLRFSADVLSGVPSIIVGMFVYGLLVITMKRFSAIAGSLALAILMLPTVARSTEELLKMVPDSLREAALALGIPRWRATLRVVLRTAAPGIATGVMLAVARAAGETAPLLFTALNSRFWPKGLDRPIASLPVQIFTYAVSPYDDWHRQAWAAALLLVALVLILNLAARILVRHRTDTR